MSKEIDAFSMFDDVLPDKQEPSVQVLYEYEQHYMDLIRQYKSEIKFIEDMLKDYREEQINFFEKQMPAIYQI